VLVVGAGPTGLALAAYLTALGVRPRLVDRNLHRVRESRALAIQPRTLEVLAGLGVTDRLVSAGNRTVQLRLHAGRRHVAVPMFDLGLADTAHPYLLFLSQAETERILAEHLDTAGVVVERGVELVTLTGIDDNDSTDGGDDGLVATLRHRDGRTETVVARYVVGCDGIRSTVRPLAGIPFEGNSYPQTFVLADADADGIEPGAAHVFLSGRGMLFFFPLLRPAGWRLLAMRPQADPTPPDAPVDLEQVQALADAYTGGTVQLRDPVWMTNFRLHHRAAARYRTGRVFLAGDAAHVHSPAGAQGMNTGIQDAHNLAWKLAHTLRGVAGPGLLDTYHSERAPIGAKVLRFTDRAFTIATSTNPLVRLARTRIAPVLIPVVLKPRAGRAYAFGTVSQLRISYRHSPLSTNGPHQPRHGPAAGDRFPDAAILHNGQPSSLHQLCADPGWHLLLCGPGNVWTPQDAAEHSHRYAGLLTVHHLTGRAPGGLGDPTGQASRRLGLGRAGVAQYLIRPDGHIGYRAGGTDVTGLAAYLTRWLQPASHDIADP
jgi:2-polyprenyl-6-methoxyphenol hydroxylase-like FAD-dependent oxidoreductase